MKQGYAGINRKELSIPGTGIEICPGLDANEIQIPYHKRHKASSFVKSHQNTHNSV